MREIQPDVNTGSRRARCEIVKRGWGTPLIMDTLAGLVLLHEVPPPARSDRWNEEEGEDDDGVDDGLK
ncbi:hypothetical protein MHYP_G00354110 [Metynnis hypsauchen]